MNCKPNDMAIVVRPCDYFAVNYDTGERKAIVGMGTVVHVVAHDGKFWRLADALPFAYTFSDGASISCKVTGIADDVLKPLPKPWEKGYDAQDELLLKAGKPEHQPA